ncbi:MAG: hypothetical protein IKL82_00970 [Clostridia bacterium]|nr:hypothetical protein [Clostridia bacterium]
MAKSVYSLLLNDEVISCVDLLARQNGLSRSNMVEKILASAVRYETPEIRAQSVFGEIEKLLSGGSTMRFIDQPSQYMASIVSAINYRYNPAIKYSVELFPNSDHLGQLKVTLRTQNPILINLMSDFYSLYSALEKNYYNAHATHIFDGVRFTRLFNFPNKTVSTKLLAQEITDYVKEFDELLNLFFSNLSSPAYAYRVVEQRFLTLKKERLVI